jgi:hypothetical protein
MQMDNVSTMAQSGLQYAWFFPENVPLPFGYRQANLSASLNGNGNILTCNLGTNLIGSTNTAASIAVNIEREGVTAGSKIANRQQFILLDLANNVAHAVGPWCLGVPDVFRLDAVYLGNSTVNTSSTNITSNFYVDHNQKEAFLDLSFLYLKPTANASILSSSNYLLVQFSYFTIVTPGWFDATSYVGSNNVLTWQNDSLPLSNLGSAVNSFEVPEMYTQAGAYYDLLSCMDFRPSVCATANTSLMSNASTAPVNPVYSTSFGNTSNPANEKQFPRPQSAIVFDMGQWMGRTDSIFLGSDGNVFTLRGIARPTAKGQLTPNQPNNCIKLNDLHVPPYPSLPKYYSNLTAQIIGTNILSNKTAGQRLANKTIQTPLTPDRIEAQQPTAYTMGDIGALDRRISDLEYYVSLSALETDMVSAVIPSSVDGTLNRFKYGIFVDDFSTSISQVKTDPEYDAQLISAVLLPNSYSWTVSQGGTNTVTSYCYVDWPVANQVTATQNTPANVVGNCVPVTLTTFQWLCIREDDDRRRGWRCEDDDDYPQTYTFVAGDAPGTISLFFHSYGAPIKVEIFQESILCRDGGDAVILVETDRVLLFGDEPPHDWFRDIDFDNFCHADFPHDRFCEGSGKITWAHNPGLGTHYLVRICKGLGCSRHRIAVQYVVNSSVIVCPTPPIPHFCEYHHHVECEPRCFRVRCDFDERDDHDIRRCIPDRDDHCFRIRHHGCRPRCRHDIFCEGIHKEHRCRPLGGHLGDPCFSDEFGILEYDFFFSADIDSDVIVSYNGLRDSGRYDDITQVVAVESITGQPGGLLLEAIAGQSYGSYVIAFADDDQALRRPF